MAFLQPLGEDSGPAADTGSAVHRAAAAYRGGADAAAAMAVMRAELSSFPQADLVDAARLFLGYTQAVGKRAHEPVLTETQVAFSLEAAPHDKTGAPIEIVGTVDDVSRNDYGRLTAWDIKTTKKSPLYVLRECQQQLAAYCVGATLLLTLAQ